MSNQILLKTREGRFLSHRAPCRLPTYYSVDPNTGDHVISFKITEELITYYSNLTDNEKAIVNFLSENENEHVQENLVSEYVTCKVLKNMLTRDDLDVVDVERLGLLKDSK